MKKNKKPKEFIECECGAMVYGNSLFHAEQNLPAHLKSKKHKELMEIKKRREDNGKS